MGQSTSGRFQLARQRNARRQAARPPPTRASVPPSRGASMMPRLADVELQIIMQHLEADEILALARCDRRSMHAAESSFAWKHVVVTLDPAQFAAAQAGASRQLPHTRLCIKMEVSSKAWGIMEDEDVAALQACAYQLYALDLSPVRWAAARHWERIFSCAHVRSIRELHVTFLSLEREDSELMTQVMELSSLHTLHAGGGLVDPSYWELLTHAPALTSLRLCDDYGNTGKSNLGYLASCASMRHLHVSNLGLSGEDFLAVFSAPLFVNLHSLTIQGFCAGLHPRFPGRAVISANQFAAAFEGLKLLRTLELINVTHIDLLLPSLTHASALRTLGIEVGGFCGATALPSAAVLAALVAAALELHVTVRHMDSARGVATLESPFATLKNGMADFGSRFQMSTL